MPRRRRSLTARWPCRRRSWRSSSAALRCVSRGLCRQCVSCDRIVGAWWLAGILSSVHASSVPPMPCTCMGPPDRTRAAPCIRTPPPDPPTSPPTPPSDPPHTHRNWPLRQPCLARGRACPACAVLRRRPRRGGPVRLRRRRQPLPPHAGVWPAPRRGGRRPALPAASPTGSTARRGVRPRSQGFPEYQQQAGHGARGGEYQEARQGRSQYQEPRQQGGADAATSFHRAPGAARPRRGLRRRVLRYALQLRPGRRGGGQSRGGGSGYRQGGSQGGGRREGGRQAGGGYRQGGGGFGGPRTDGYSGECAGKGWGGGGGEGHHPGDEIMGGTMNATVRCGWAVAVSPEFHRAPHRCGLRMPGPSSRRRTLSLERCAPPTQATRPALSGRGVGGEINFEESYGAGQDRFERTGSAAESQRRCPSLPPWLGA